MRDAGVPPRDVAVPAGTPDAALGTAVAAEVARLAERYDGGSVGVVAPRERLAHLGTAVDGVPVLSTSEAKGLEWDAVVVVDPDGIAAEPRGWNGLYVAMTRCTQELARVTVDAPSGSA